jgi:hypothetical protein
VREIMDKLDPKPKPQPLPAPGKRVEPSLAVGEEAASVVNCLGTDAGGDPVTPNREPVRAARPTQAQGVASALSDPRGPAL